MNADDASKKVVDDREHRERDEKRENGRTPPYDN
jgi:hypothetical protein